jgi:hypothetical protein
MRDFSVLSKICILINISLSCLVLYGCETWFLALSEEHRLRVYEKKVLRRIFTSKEKKVSEDWRKLKRRGLIL